MVIFNSYVKLPEGRTPCNNQSTRLDHKCAAHHGGTVLRAAGWLQKYRGASPESGDLVTTKALMNQIWGWVKTTIDVRSIPLYTYMGMDRYGSIPISTIFRGMNIHLPAILM